MNTPNENASTSSAMDTGEEYPINTARNDRAKKIYCAKCHIYVDVKGFPSHRKTEQHKNAGKIIVSDGVFLIGAVENGYIEEFRVESILKNEILPKKYFVSVKPKILALLQEKMVKHGSIKYNLKLFGEYVKYTENSMPETIENALSNDEMEFSYKNFVSPYLSVYCDIELEDSLQNHIEKICQLTDEFQERNSGWAVTRFIHFDIQISKLNHIGAGEYIEIPTSLSKRGSIINIKNQFRGKSDDFCFKWSIFAAIEVNRLKNEGINICKDISKLLRKMSYYEIMDIKANIINFQGIILNFKNMKFPTDFHDIKIFEKNNPRFSINVYAVKPSTKKENRDKKELSINGPSRRSSSVREFHINLLEMSKPNSGILKSRPVKHFSLIHNLRRLIKKQFVTSNTPSVFCDFCQCHYSTARHLHNERECGKVTSKFPEEGAKLKFKNTLKKLSPPIVVYADIESVLLPVSGVWKENSATNTINKHEACAVSFYIKHTYNSDLDKEYTFEGNKFILLLIL